MLEIRNLLSILSLGSFKSRKKANFLDSNNQVFNKFYEAEILNKSQGLTHKKTVTLVGIRLWLSIILIVLCFGNISISETFYIIIFLCIINTINISKNHKNKLIKIIANKTLKFFGELEYNHKYSESVRNMSDFRIIPAYHIQSCKDHIMGKYKNKNLEIFNCTLRKIYKDRFETVFSGTIIKLQINKKFNSTTIIKKDLGFLFNLMRGEGLTRVKLEDPIFEKEFEVYSDDQMEARYLITPTFMERLLEFKKIFNKKLSISFHQEHILVLIHNNKISMPFISYSEPLDFYSEAKHLESELSKIFKAIDKLKLI